MVQKILESKNDCSDLDNWIKTNNCKKIFLVCDDSIKYQKEFFEYFSKINNSHIDVM